MKLPANFAQPTGFSQSMVMTLKLLKRVDDLDEPLAEMLFDKEKLTIGRGEDRDIRIDDPSRIVSKNHCEIFRRGEAVLLRDTSSNGVCVNDSEDPIARGETILITSGDRLTIGDFVLEVGCDGLQHLKAAGNLNNEADADRLDAPILSDAPCEGQDVNVPTDWNKSGATEKLPEITPAPGQSSADGKDLLLAFLEGAELDPRALAGEDPAKILYAGGVIYKQTVLSFSDILNDRLYLKNEFDLERTMMGKQHNNPLKYFGAQEAAIALLATPQDGFIESKKVIEEASRDIKKHQLALVAAMRETIKALVASLNPATIRAQAEEDAGDSAAEGDVATAAWRDFERLYENIVQDGSTNRNSTLNKKFQKAYESHIEMLDNLL